MKSNFVYNKSNFIIKLFYIKKNNFVYNTKQNIFSCFPHRGLDPALSYM